MAVATASVTDSKATVQVTAPSSGPTGGWARYDLTVCLPSSGCSSPAVQCSPVTDPGTTDCDLTGLLPGLAYTVRAEAVAGSGTSTIRSQAGSQALTTKFG